MIADDKRTVLISTMGWNDRNDLWVLEVRSGTPRRLSIGSEAKYLTLHGGTDGYFAIAHHFDGPRFEVTAHAFTDPPAVIARASVSASGGALSGDVSTWARVPRLYAPYITLPGLQDFVLVRINATRGTVDVQPLSWYDDRYDKGYQGVISVTELPGDLAVFSVQRSSTLVLHDLDNNVNCGLVDLGGRGGNSRLWFRSRASEVWASDYDTIVKLNPATWQVTADMV